MHVLLLRDGEEQKQVPDQTSYGRLAIRLRVVRDLSAITNITSEGGEEVKGIIKKVRPLVLDLKVLLLELCLVSPQKPRKNLKMQ